MIRAASLPPTLTVQDVADRLRVDPAKITRRIRAGELRALNVANPGSRRPRYRIDPDALAEFEESISAATTSSTPPAQRRRKKSTLPAGFVRYF